MGDENNARRAHEVRAESISHTRKVAFRRCKRMHHLIYDRGIRPAKTAIQLTIGTLFHLWIEAWLNTVGLEGPMWVSPTGVSHDDDWWSDDPWSQMEHGFAQLDASDPYEAARLRAMVLAYHLRWRSQHWNVIAVEAEFVAEIRDPDDRPSDLYRRTGKIDAIVEDDMQIWAVEHKTNLGPLDPDDNYWIKLRSDAQCSDYHIGAASLGYEIAGIVYDVVCKPDLEPLRATPIDKQEMTIGWGCKACGGDKDKRGTGLGDSLPPNVCPPCRGTGWRAATDKSPSGEPRYKAHVRLRDETPGEYGLRCFQAMVAEPNRYLIRRPVVRLADELREHELDDWETVRDIHADKQRDHHPRNTDACFAFKRRCDYHPACFGSVDPEQSTLYTISKRPARGA